MKKCIKNGNIISMDESKDYILYNTDVLIDGNKIIKIDKNIHYFVILLKMNKKYFHKGAWHQ